MFETLKPYSKDVVLHYDVNSIPHYKDMIRIDRVKMLKELKATGKIEEKYFTPAVGDLLLMHLLEEREDGCYYPINDCLIKLEVMLL